MLNNLQQMRLKLSNSKRAIQKAAEATGDLIVNEIANEITGGTKHLQKYNSEAVTNDDG